jgi:hypothetical protein
MAVHCVARLGELAPGLVLAAERYHPGRRLGAGDSVALGSLVELSAELVSPGDGAELFLVLDTSDAAEGFLVAGKAPVPRHAIGSAKKRVRPGDLLVSRLRPYLRQIALCDAELAPTGVEVVCSTEFFVLRGSELAFLVPYLLSGGPQRALAASVEGGHHPRFGKQALLELPVPRALCEAREAISRQVLEAVRLRRQSERLMAAAIPQFSSKT